MHKLKQALTGAPLLSYPEPALQFVLDPDASSIALGAVLSQQQEGQERVIAYFSRALSRPERHYCVTRKELLAVVRAILNTSTTTSMGEDSFSVQIIQLSVGCWVSVTLRGKLPDGLRASNSMILLWNTGLVPDMEMLMLFPDVHV